MTTLLLFVLFALGLIGGFFSGLLGIGGGIIMVPLLLYVPLLMGLEAIPCLAVRKARGALHAKLMTLKRIVTRILF